MFHSHPTTDAARIADDARGNQSERSTLQDGWRARRGDTWLHSTRLTDARQTRCIRLNGIQVRGCQITSSSVPRGAAILHSRSPSSAASLSFIGPGGSHAHTAIDPSTQQSHHGMEGCGDEIVLQILNDATLLATRASPQTRAGGGVRSPTCLWCYLL